jgi:hypothetical protein
VVISLPASASLRPSKTCGSGGGHGKVLIIQSKATRPTKIAEYSIDYSTSQLPKPDE